MKRILLLAAIVCTAFVISGCDMRFKGLESYESVSTKQDSTPGKGDPGSLSKSLEATGGVAPKK